MIGAILTILVEDALRGLSGPIGRRLRYSFYKRRLKALGKNAIIDVGVKILNPELVSIGDNTWIDNYVVIIAGKGSDRGGPILRKVNEAFKYDEGEVVIGPNCHIAMFVVIQGHGGVSIGANSGVASGSKIYSMSHHYANPNDPSDRTIYKFSTMAGGQEQSLIISPVVMEDNTALGLNSVLLPGATLRRNSWVGTNSMAIKATPPNTISSGVAAKVVATRDLIDVDGADHD